MDITFNMLHALNEQQARNAAYTEAELETSRADGAKALVDAIARGEAILVMDEASNNRVFNAYAVGWNSEWAKAAAKRQGKSHHV